MKSPLVIVPVHNRRDVTLAGLRHLRAAEPGAWFRVCVVDDGSTDGTGGAVHAEFPEVEILRGNGQLWWTGAICLGLRHALTEGAEFVFWLNDDTLPEPGALAALLEESRRTGGVAGGVSFLPYENEPAYGGLRETWGGLVPVAGPGLETVPCAALHGNLVCLPASIVQRIGWPDEARLPHALADLDYTLRAHRAGIPVILVGRARAKAQPNLSLNYRSWLLSDVPMSRWWRELARRGSHMNLRAQAHFRWRHWGIAGLGVCAGMVVRLALVSVLRGIVPLSALRRWYGRRSRSWQHEQRHRA